MAKWNVHIVKTTKNFMLRIDSITSMILKNNWWLESINIINFPMRCPLNWQSHKYILLSFSNL